ncbi:phage tail-collar fiber domain-containing protein [Selenomonas ruminantium]|uniref:Phage tail-collar fibre protein n=1 Tax=Selenomonas ruminantium TaxID=971 RepID=A0A1H0P8T3_SELRU|nr:phage tail protein [Selenomonas ruminantium]SDP01115.1 Phage tail-collar fibre protein [Selenomonas ruminantium]
MANWTGGVLTAAGRALQAKVTAGLTSLQLTRIKLGDGTEGSQDIDVMTDLRSPKSSLGISSITHEDNMCTVTGLILTSSVNTGYYAREWGVFATDPDIGEILYMVSLDSVPDWVPPSTAALTVSAEYAMTIAVENAANIVVNIDPAGLVSTEMLARAACLRQTGTAYAEGAILYDTQLAAHPDWRLECTTAGTTSNNLLDLTGLVLGDSITDGTAVWTIKRAYTTEGDFFEIDEYGDLMPTAEPRYSVNFELDEYGDIVPKAQ